MPLVSAGHLSVSSCATPIIEDTFLRMPFIGKAQGYAVFRCLIQYGPHWNRFFFVPFLS